MMAKQITYVELDKLLARLGFVESRIESRWRAYRHAESDSLIILSNRDRTLPAREVELVSVRRHLVDNDLIDEREFDGLLVQDHRS
jgi:hypothetical protein